MKYREVLPFETLVYGDEILIGYPPFAQWMPVIGSLGRQPASFKKPYRFRRPFDGITYSTKGVSVAEPILYRVLTHDDIIKEGDEHVFISPSEWTPVKSSVECKAGWIWNWVYRRKVLDLNTHRFMRPGEWTGVDDEFTYDGGLTWEPAKTGLKVTEASCEKYRRRKNRLYRALKAGETTFRGDEVSFCDGRNWEPVVGLDNTVIGKYEAESGIFYRRPVLTPAEADPIPTIPTSSASRELSGKYRTLGPDEKIQAGDEFCRPEDDIWGIKQQDGNCGMLVKRWSQFKWRRPLYKGEYRYIRGGIRLRKGDECRPRLSGKKFGPWGPVRFSWGQRVSAWPTWQFRRPV